jgi:hypothetical protein
LTQVSSCWLQFDHEVAEAASFFVAATTLAKYPQQLAKATAAYFATTVNYERKI